MSYLFDGFQNSGRAIPQFSQFFRAIKYPAKPSLVSDLSYPPLNLSRINRANLEGEQMFYCSNHVNAPFYELHLEKGDRAVISNWTNTIPMTTNNIGYTDKNFQALGSEKADADSFSQPQPLGTPENKAIAIFLAELFCGQVNEAEEEYYKLTTAIAHWAFNYEVFAALMYPTIKMHANADNYAIKKVFVDSGYLQLISAQYIEVSAILGEIYAYKLLDYSEKYSSKGIINWCNPENRWVLRTDQDAYFNFEDGLLKVYDSNQDEIAANTTN
jgi:hypothetical protein